MEEPTREDTQKWQQRLTRIKDSIELARWNLARAHQNQKHHYDLRRRDWRPQIGDKMMKHEHHLGAAAKQFNAKLAPKFAGPHIVTKFTGPNVVVLKGARGKTMRAHISDLKPWEYREPVIGADSATSTAIIAVLNERSKTIDRQHAPKQDVATGELRESHSQGIRLRARRPAETLPLLRPGDRQSALASSSEAETPATAPTNATAQASPPGDPGSRSTGDTALTLRKPRGGDVPRRDHASSPDRS